MSALSSELHKRDRRSAARVEQLERQILDVLRSDHPQSVRHVFYRMTDPRLPEPVDKSDRGYTQVQNRITLLRRSGVLPYGWITDSTRRGYHVETYNSPHEFIRETAFLYRRNLWTTAEHYVEVWCESRIDLSANESGGANIVSLFGQNLLAAKLERVFSFATIPADSVAIINSVSYTNAASG